MPDDAHNLPEAVTLRHNPPPLSILRDPSRFEFTQRVARLYSESQLVPQHLRGKLADCFIALQMADAMGEDPLMVMQNIYIVNAKAGWSAQYMIARTNRSGRFQGPLRWRSEGQGESLIVTCYADLAGVAEGERVEVPVSMAMAKADGWTRNDKYKSIPEQMLRWRSATWLIRLYCPEVMMGLPSADELEDLKSDWDDRLKDATPPRPRAEDFTEESPRRRGRPAKPAEPVEEKQQPQPQTAKFFFADADGEVHEFAEWQQATAAYAEMLEAARTERELVAAWENGAQLLSALRESDHDSPADMLGKQYSEMMAALQNPDPSAPAQAQATAKADPPAATAEEPDVLVPYDGGSTQEWFYVARDKLKKGMAGHPPSEFSRFRQVNADTLVQLGKEFPSWRKILDKILDEEITKAGR